MIKLLEHTRRPDITFCRNGRIHITAEVVRLLALQPGDSINVAFDPDTAECWLCAAHHTTAVGRHIAQCYPTQKGSLNFRASSVSLARFMLHLCGSTEPRVALCIGTEPKVCNKQVFLPIIYKMPL